METEDRFVRAKYAMNTRMFLLIAGVILIFNAVTSAFPYGMRLLSVARLVSEYQEDGAAAAVTEDAAVSGAETVSAAEAAAAEVSAMSGAETVSAAEAAAAETGAMSGAEAVSAVSGAETESAAAAASQEIDVGALKSDMEKLGVTVSDFRRVGVMNIVMAVIRIAVGFLCVVFCNRVDKSRLTLTAAIALVVCEVIFAVLMYLNRFLGIGSLLYSAMIAGLLLVGALRMRKIAREDPDRKLAVENVRRPAAERPEAAKRSIKEKAMMGGEAEDGEEEQTPAEQEDAE